MRVATKIVTLTATLVALLVVVLVLQLWWVGRLAAVTESLPATTFRVGSANLALSRALFELRDISLKLDVSGADYLTGWEALREAARNRVRALASLELSPGERGACRRCWSTVSRCRRRNHRSRFTSALSTPCVET